MALITVANASLAFEGTIAASGLDFCVQAGDYLCIVGQNGSGKTTLLKGLLQLKAPVLGTITYGEGFSAAEAGYLPQQIPAQRDFPASVWEVVLSGCLASRGLRPWYSRANKQRARHNLERLGVADLARRCYPELSGGQQQRVLLARALNATTRLLLLDEPTSGLDPLVTQELYQLLWALNQEGITIVMVSHNVESALRYASHILHLNTHQEFFGSTSSYLGSAAHRNFAGCEGHGGEVRGQEGHTQKGTGQEAPHGKDYGQRGRAQEGHPVKAHGQRGRAQEGNGQEEHGKEEHV